MECPNCTFRSIPGSTVCARCGSRLDLDALPVEPPRAGRGVVARRVRPSVRSVLFRVRDAADDLPAGYRALFPDPVPPGTLVWSLVPGGGWRHAGYPRFAAFGFALWAVLLLASFLLVRSAAGWTLLIAAVGFHAFLSTSVFARVMGRWPIHRALLGGVGIYLAVIFGVYAPGAFVLSQVALAIEVPAVHGAQSGIRGGDVVLAQGSLLRDGEVEAGDIVVYRLPRAIAGGYAVASGLAMDRVVGLAGDRIEVREDGVHRNGRLLPPDMAPLRGTRHMVGLSFIVPEENVAILPTLQMWSGNQGVASEASCVPRRLVRGRVFFRIRPFDRAGFLPRPHPETTRP